MNPKTLSWPLALVVLAVLGSCGGSGDLEGDLSRGLAPYQVLDLTTGTMTGRISLPDLQTNADYRDKLMVFRRIPAGQTAVGTALTGFGGGEDPAAGQGSVPAFYCGVFEVTQGQWQILAGTTPWSATTTVPADSLGIHTTDVERPAYGLSKDLLALALVAHNTGKAYSLVIPTNLQWERACRAGTSTSFAWGNNPNDRATAANYAVVHETAQGQSGPRQVGERLANGFGLFDMHGNVWEITHEGLNTSIRGGSWRDPLSLSRAAHVVDIDRATAHALVGARLVLIP